MWQKLIHIPEVEGHLLTPQTRKAKGASGFRTDGSQIQRTAFPAPPLHIASFSPSVRRLPPNSTKSLPLASLKGSSSRKALGRIQFGPSLSKCPILKPSLYGQRNTRPEKQVWFGQKHIPVGTGVGVEACHNRMIVALAACHGAGGRANPRRGWRAC